MYYSYLAENTAPIIERIHPKDSCVVQKNPTGFHLQVLHHAEEMFACRNGGCQSETALHTFWAYILVGRQGKNAIEDEIDGMQKGTGARKAPRKQERLSCELP